MRLKFIFFILLTFVAKFSVISAQQIKYSTEKIFFHSDKPFYASNDTIKFAIYLIEDGSKKLSKTSEIVNVTLWDKELKILSQQKVLMSNGLGYSKIYLSEEIPTGDYLITCSSNWMLNFTNQNYSKFPIKIFNKNDYPLTDVSPSKKPSVEAYIEGGNLINGRLNKVIFKFEGEHKHFSGEVWNDQGDNLVEIKHLKEGYGTATFYVKDSINYRAKLIIDGKEKLLKIGSGSHNIASLFTSRMHKQNRIVGANVGNNLIGDTVRLLVKNNGDIILKTERQISTPTEFFALPVNLLSDGLNQVQLLNNKDSLISERLIYNKTQFVDSLNLSIKISEHKFRKKAIIEFDSLEDYRMSISVVNADLFSKSMTQNIDLYVNLLSPLGLLQLSNSLLLSLKDESFLDDFLICQKVENSKNRTEHLSFKKQLLFKPEKKDAINIEGKIINKFTNKPLVDTLMYVSTLSDVNSIQIVEIDEKGHFTVEIPSFYGNSELILKVIGISENEEYLDYEIFNKAPKPKISDFNITHKPSIDDVNEYLKFIKDKNIIDHAYLTKVSNSIDQTNNHIDFFQGYSFKLDYSEYILLSSFSEIAKELIPDIEIYKKQIFLREYSEDKGYYLNRYDSEPFILLDGLPVYNSTIILSLKPEHIERIQIINKPYYISGKTFNGIIEIATKNANFGKLNFTNHYVQKIEGFKEKPSVIKLKKSKDSNSPKDKLPYLNATPYWNPNINSTISINYIIPDGSSNYIIDIQGTDGNGQFIHFNLPVVTN